MPDRDAVINGLENTSSYFRHLQSVGFFGDQEIYYEHEKHCNDAITLLKDHERETGEWKWISSTYDRTPCEMRFYCSCCSHETIVHSNTGARPWEKYCPECGTKMQ